MSQEEKHVRYKRFNWTDEKWQSHLNNFYPLPNVKQLEKIKKKWYKKNQDPDFDIEFDPEKPAEPTAQAPGGQPGANPGTYGYGAYGGQGQKQTQQPAGSGAYEALPTLKGIQFILWVIFILTVIPRLYTNYFAFAALLCGILRRTGRPQFNMGYLQSAMVDENFQLLGYTACAAMVGGVNIVMYVPLMIHAVIVCSEISCADSTPGPLGFISQIGFIKNQFVSKVGDAGKRRKLKETQQDIEVYLGFYLIAVWFIGWSHFLAIMLYWQQQRVRYMMSTETQLAFTRFNGVIHEKVLDKPFCPGMVRTVYEKIATQMSSMGQRPEAPAAGGQQGGGFMQKAMSQCNIF